MESASATELTEQRRPSSVHLEGSNPHEPQRAGELDLGRSNTRQTIDIESDAGTQESLELEPRDHGLAAWKMLFGAFVFEALLWGKSFLFPN